MKGRRRSRLLVLNDRQEILLVRSWFGRQRWSLPGGGIRPGEDIAAAAVRETYEESGVVIDARSCQPLGEFENGDSSAPFTVVCQVAVTTNQPVRIAARHRLEILDAAWFALESLPSQRSSTVDSALVLHLDRK